MRTAGYDGTISIEHEDGLLSVDEGVDKAAASLAGILFQEPAPSSTWWT